MLKSTTKPPTLYFYTDFSGYMVLTWKLASRHQGIICLEVYLLDGICITMTHLHIFTKPHTVYASCSMKDTLKLIKIITYGVMDRAAYVATCWYEVNNMFPCT